MKMRKVMRARTRMRTFLCQTAPCRLMKTLMMGMTGTPRVSSLDSLRLFLFSSEDRTEQQTSAPEEQMLFDGYSLFLLFLLSHRFRTIAYVTYYSFNL